MSTLGRIWVRPCVENDVPAALLLKEVLQRGIRERTPKEAACCSVHKGALMKVTDVFKILKTYEVSAFV